MGVQKMGKSNQKKIAILRGACIETNQQPKLERSPPEPTGPAQPGPASDNNLKYCNVDSCLISRLNTDCTIAVSKKNTAPSLHAPTPLILAPSSPKMKIQTQSHFAFPLLSYWPGTGDFMRHQRRLGDLRVGDRGQENAKSSRDSGKPHGAFA